MRAITPAVLTAFSLSIFAIASPASTGSAAPIFQTTCAGQTYSYNEFAGYGFLAGDSRDKYGDTIGGIGSSVAIDKKTWKRKSGLYTAILYALPDRY